MTHDQQNNMNIFAFIRFEKIGFGKKSYNWLHPLEKSNTVTTAKTTNFI